MSAPTSVWDMSLAAFRDAIETRSMPGCGAAAAASAGFGLALMLKGLRISESKAPDVQRAALIERADALLEELGRYADEDIEAFDAYMAALRGPRDSAREGIRRDQAIERAALQANRIPLATAQLCRDALELTVAALPLTAANLHSDTIAGGLLLHSGLSGVLLNVDANIESLPDAAQREAAARSRKSLQHDADRRVEWLQRQAGTT